MTETRRLLGVVMDPIETIKPKKDSTLAMLIAAQKHGFGIVYLRQQDLVLRNGAPVGHGQRVTVQDDYEHWFDLGDAWSGGRQKARLGASAQGLPITSKPTWRWSVPDGSSCRFGRVQSYWG